VDKCGFIISILLAEALADVRLDMKNSVWSAKWLVGRVYRPASRGLSSSDMTCMN